MIDSSASVLCGAVRPPTASRADGLSAGEACPRRVDGVETAMAGVRPGCYSAAGMIGFSDTTSKVSSTDTSACNLMFAVCLPSVFTGGVR